MSESKEKSSYKNFWDNRYSDNSFAYGTRPNEFFKYCIQQLEKGSILLPADGEGRNGVYAATLGWKVTSNDLSEEAKRKAGQLALENNVDLEYLVGDLSEVELSKNSFDCVAVIFAHFSADKLNTIFSSIDRWLKPNGHLIFEAYSKNQLSLKAKAKSIGGPDDERMLFEVEKLKKSFPNYSFEILNETIVDLNEGEFHKGPSSVIRAFGRKLK